MKRDKIDLKQEVILGVALVPLAYVFLLVMRVGEYGAGGFHFSEPMSDRLFQAIGVSISVAATHAIWRYGKVQPEAFSSKPSISEVIGFFQRSRDSFIQRKMQTDAVQCDEAIALVQRIAIDSLVNTKEYTSGRP